MKIDNLEILNGLIAGAEGGTVEFKETTGQLDEARYCGNHQTNRAVCDH